MTTPLPSGEPPASERALNRSRLPNKRAWVAFAHDVAMAALSFIIAMALRLGEDVMAFLREPATMQALAIFTVICAVIFWFAGLYRGIWRYASLQDVANIVRAVTLALLLFLPLTFLATRLEALPRSFLIIDWFVLIFLLATPRILYRVLKDRGFDHLLEKRTIFRVPVLLVGASDAAEMFIRDLSRDPARSYDVVGILDEKGTRVGRQIRGVQVMDDLDHLDRAVAELRRNEKAPQRLIVTRKLSREQMARLLRAAELHGMTLARLPRLTDFKTGSDGDEAQRMALRPVAIEDLLGRPQASLDKAAMERLIAGRRVLVTGAGGSIGSELARQAAQYGPARLVLLDHSEYLLYSIDIELSEIAPALDRRAVLCDVGDRAALERVFLGERPALVLHAAALKHVPLAEANPEATALTNVGGTRNVAEACRSYGVAAMVQVSTDKAINPTGVMGASKRLAESFCQAMDLAERGRVVTGKNDHCASGSGTRFVTVRFGNVLGSNGSVVPLFQRQLARGGPITVTHPEMRRYFMTVREAVQLVLQASALGLSDGEAEEVGKIYVLNMGEPVKIVDLARQVIRLAGFTPDKDIEIVYTGLRPGEKLHEELFHDGEPMLATSHPDLKLAAARTANLDLLNRGIDEMLDHARNGRGGEVLATLRRLVPEYAEYAEFSEADEEAGEPAAMQRVQPAAS